MDALISTFRETGTALDRGIHFNGAKYKCVRADKNSIYARKASCELDYPVCMVLLWMMFPLQEGSGFVAVKTGSLIVFGSYSSVMFPSVCVEAVERLGEGHITFIYYSSLRDSSLTLDC